jgi:hypothetical protein
LLARDPVVLRIVHHSTTEIIFNFYFYSHWSLASRTARLCRLFLLDRNAIAAIHHDFQIRYSSTFSWLEKFCAKRQHRTVLPLLLGAVDISRTFEVRIWKKGTVRGILRWHGCSSGEILAYWSRNREFGKSGKEWGA